jgi:exosome complex component RRP42
MVSEVMCMILQEQYLVNLASKGERIDKRKPHDYRKVTVEKDVIEKAEGSARVRIGETEVIVGVKMNLGEPYPDKPDEGVMIVGAEFSPMASPEFETGPPGENAIELARVVDRGIRESGTMDTKKLCIKKGEKVWLANVDIHILNHSGNLIDAAALAAVTALWNTRMPEVKDEKVNYGKKTSKKLPVGFKPITVTMVRIGESLFVDPNLDEEDVMNMRLSIAVKDDDNVCAMQKGGPGTLTMDEIRDALDIAVKKSREMRKLIE